MRICMSTAGLGWWLPKGPCPTWSALRARMAAGLLIAILPELHQINASYPFVREQQKIKNVLAAQDVPVIDLIEGLRGHGAETTLWATPTDPHPNGKANELMAAQILPWVLQMADRTKRALPAPAPPR